MLLPPLRRQTVQIDRQHPVPWAHLARLPRQRKELPVAAIWQAKISRVSSQVW